MATGMALAELLGFDKAPTGMSEDAAVVARLKGGLPVEAVDRLASVVAPDDRTFAFSLVKRATLNRRRVEVEPRLTFGEGERVVRLAKVWAFAREVWNSDAEARDFLRRPHALLENRPPLDIVLESEFGGPRVEAVLGRLKYGSAA